MAKTKPEALEAPPIESLANRTNNATNTISTTKLNKQMYKFYYTNGYGVTSYIRKSMASLWQRTWNPNIRKWLMRINLTCLILLIAFMQVSLAANAQKISLSKKNATLTEVFRELKKRSSYGFMINREQIKMAKPVTVNFSSEELEKVLEKCFEGQPFTYKLEGKMIVVVDKKPGQVKISAPTIDVKGRLVDENGAALVGASVNIKGTDLKTITNENGEFSFTNVDEKAILVISFIGYGVQEITVKADLGSIKMMISTGRLNEVSVTVNTGYQILSKERATGSFAVVDNELLNRRTSTDIISRIEDVTPGVIFNRAGAGNDPISIRGRSTIFANARPLIVIDNFPYDGDLININPNDVETITVLKDAAASSIWGARAGNGVIVITTKKGKFNSSINVSFNSNITVGEKPDQFYQSKMSTSDFIDVEKMLFARGQYQSAENSTARTPLTPVVELLIAKRNGSLSAQEADMQIEMLKAYDVRNDFDKYFNRNSVNQQYSFSLNGGSHNQKFLVSIGYDRNLASLVNNDFSRITLNGNNTYSFLKDKLQINTAIYITSGKTNTNNPGTNSILMKSGFLYPYARLADETGNPLSIVKDYRIGYTEQAISNGLLNWQYSPLEEIRIADNKSTSNDYRINTSINYKILPFLTIEGLYQFNYTVNGTDNLRGLGTYFTRDLINNFSQAGTNGANYVIPYGSIMDISDSNLKNHNIRGQVNFKKYWVDKHEVNAIGGIEQRELITENRAYRLYGYDEEHITNRPVDYIALYPQRYNTVATARIPFLNSGSAYNDRYRSFYFNGSYSFDHKYMFSLSGRIDQSNLFGVKTNQKSVPLWSAGLAWNINDEKFYSLEWLPVLKLRGTFGYSGNIDKNVSAYTTANYLSAALNTGLPYAQIRTSGNPDLRWEKIGVLNLGFDFSTKNSIINGSVEYYSKKGNDIIGNISYAPSTGISAFRGNFANTLVNGIDVVLNTKNIDNDVKWHTNFLFSVAKEKVTQYFQQSAGTTYLNTIGTPAMGRPIFSVFSYKWGGLDPTNGDPIGYLNGEESKNYASISSTSSPENLIYNGSLRPQIFGSFRNTVSWKNLSVSANISYRLGYYFRQQSLTYGSVLIGSGGHGDYSNRWQNPGDELVTNVPSMPASTNSARDNFYTYSEALVKKGDHFRLQDISLSYTLQKNSFAKLPIQRCQFYLYANNLGIIWKADKGNIDPDYPTQLPIKTIAFGLKVDF
ncbi:MAG: SusC/RagA family TonB-linked outer membrane protein [Chryseobacterium sp.]|nr:MAG: SusC/RagA family TonB-linked outer membrane protein [Chryseobacterium sp.]